MKKPISKDFENQAERYLEKIDKCYVYDATSRLYKPKAPKTGREVKRSGQNRSLPFWVDVRRDWLVFCTSLLSLTFIFVTVYYTRKQWVAANNTLGEISKQTISAQQSAEAADRASVVSQRAERESERFNSLARSDAEKTSRSSAKQATDSLNATIDNFHQEQRAWVGISRFDRNAAGDLPLLINTGRTPANQVESIMGIYNLPKGQYMWTDFDMLTANSIWMSNIIEARRSGLLKESDVLVNDPILSKSLTSPFRYLPSLFPPVFRLKDTLVAPFRTSQGVVPPGIAFPMQSVGSQHTDGTFLNIVFGKITYRDISPKSPQREKTFCYYLVNPKTDQWQVCNIYNEMK